MSTHASASGDEPHGSLDAFDAVTVTVAFASPRHLPEVTVTGVRPDGLSRQRIAVAVEQALGEHLDAPVVVTWGDDHAYETPTLIVTTRDGEQIALGSITLR